MTIKQNNQLTDKQMSIVLSETYPQYVRAGAGTGKTEVLINKILHIIETENVSLGNFGIITFTNKAAEELKSRLSQIIYAQWSEYEEDEDLFIRNQAELVSMTDINTIHGFCEKLLRDYGMHTGIPTNFKIKSFRREMTAILHDVVNKNYDSGLLKDILEYKVIRLLDALMTNNSNHGIVLDRAVADQCLKNSSADVLWQSFKKLFLEMYLEAQELIEKQKKEENVLTPNDLISKTVELLEIDYVAKKVAEQYKYIFIDEFQDTNKDQFNLVNILITHGVKIFLVGDDKQSIYGFRGADVENSMEMHSIIKLMQEKNAEEIYMNENFRADKSLIETVNKIFQTKFYHNTTALRFPHEPLAIPESVQEQEDRECLEISHAEPIESVIERIVATKEIDGRVAEYSDIVILCRRNFDLDRISASLKEKGYPVEVVGGKGFYRAKEVVDTYKLLNALINYDKAYQNELAFTDYYASIMTSKNIEETPEELMEEFRTVIRRETVEESLTYFYEKSLILEYYRQKKQFQAIANLHKLKDLARELINKDNMQPIQFLDYLNIMITSGQEEDEADVSEIEREKGVIRVYSIHKAKGLSFPIVIVPCIDTKLNRPITRPKIIFDSKSDKCRIGFNNKELSDEIKTDRDYIKLLEVKTIEQLEEELRVFYVACTRAKHHIVLLTEKTKAEVEQTGTWKDNASVAKWLMQIDNGEFYREFTKQL